MKAGTVYNGLGLSGIDRQMEDSKHRADGTKSHPKINVMLVEDHALTRVGLRTALRRTDDILVVAEAGNGQEAIDLAKQHRPDVILMDVGMPVMDGVQSARAILREEPSIKVIMLTQHDNDSDVMASLAAGASGYCLKDIEPERLYMAIRSVNAGDSWLDAGIAGRVLKHYAGTVLNSDASSSAAAPAAVPSQSEDENQLPPYVESLSPRELEVLKLIVDGFSNQEIANKLIISLPTAKSHVRSILNKLAVDDRTQAAVHAMRRGLV